MRSPFIPGDPHGGKTGLESPSNSSASVSPDVPMFSEQSDAPLPSSDMLEPAALLAAAAVTTATAQLDSLLRHDQSSPSVAFPATSSEAERAAERAATLLADDGTLDLDEA